MLNYEALLDALDLDAIVAAIRTVELRQPDYADAASMVLKAIRKWGPQDYLGLAIEAVEQRFSLELPEAGGLIPHLGIGEEPLGERHVKGYVDLMGTRQIQDRAEREVIDWKTTGSISSEQQDRLRHSWQGKLYGAAYGCDKIVFRSIQRDGRTAELRMPWPQTAYTDADVAQHYRQCFAVRDVFRDEAQWLQHSPFACRAYGRECPYKSLCVVHNQAPRKVLEFQHLSYSSAETLLLCPERHRLDKVLDTDDGSDDTNLGTAFHAGVACAWQQIQKLQRS